MLSTKVSVGLARSLSAVSIGAHHDHDRRRRRVDRSGRRDLRADDRPEGRVRLARRVDRARSTAVTPPPTSPAGGSPTAAPRTWCCRRSPSRPVTTWCSPAPPTRTSTAASPPTGCTATRSCCTTTPTAVILTERPRRRGGPGRLVPRAAPHRPGRPLARARPPRCAGRRSGELVRLDHRDDPRRPRQPRAPERVRRARRDGRDHRGAPEPGRAPATTPASGSSSTTPAPPPIDLGGWTVKDDDRDRFTVPAGVIVPAGGYAVLGTSATGNGGVTLDHVYGTGDATPERLGRARRRRRARHPRRPPRVGQRPHLPRPRRRLDVAARPDARQRRRLGLVHRHQRLGGRRPWHARRRLVVPPAGTNPIVVTEVMFDPETPTQRARLGVVRGRQPRHRLPST